MKSMIAFVLAWLPMLSFAHGDHDSDLSGLSHAFMHYLMQEGGLILGLLLAGSIGIWWYVKNKKQKSEE